MPYAWDFAPVLRHLDLLLLGLAHTVEIAAVSIVLGVALGLGLAALKLSGVPLLRVPASAFVEIYRNTPPILHFFWFFYALPVVLDVSLDPFVAAVLALSTQSGAFYAEVFRGGILAVGEGQREGGKALGMTRAQAMRRIVIPQATALMIPPFVERSFELVKTTALASTLAYADLLYQAMQVNSETYRPLEVYTVVALLYLVLLVSASALARLVEHRATAHVRA